MSARLVEYRGAVAAGIKAFLPGLRTADTILGRYALEDLTTRSFAAPAVFVGTPLVEPAIGPSEMHAFKVQAAAFIVTEGRTQEDDAWTMAEAIALKLTPAQRWGLNNISAPGEIRITPILTAQRQARAVSMVAVSWTQTLSRLGTNIFDADGHVLKELYLDGEEVDLNVEAAP